MQLCMTPAPGFFSDGHLAADRLTGVEAVASVALQLCDGLYMYESGDGLVAAFVEGAYPLPRF